MLRYNGDADPAGPSGRKRRIARRFGMTQGPFREPREDPGVRRNVILLAALAGLLSRTAGGIDYGEPLVALHRGYACGPKSPAMAQGWTPCTDCGNPNEARIPCSAYSVHEGDLLRALGLYLMVAHVDPEAGVAGLALTIDYEVGPQAGVGIFGWTLCGDAEAPSGDWPNPGSGNRIVWDTEGNCQVETIGSEGVHAVAGWLYAYAYGDSRFRVRVPGGDPPGTLEVLDCLGNVVIPQQESPVLGFGGIMGFNPCAGGVAARASTWGRIKSVLGSAQRGDAAASTPDGTALVVPGRDHGRNEEP